MEYDQTRLKLACEGKSESQGGYNLPFLKKLASSYNITASSRAEHEQKLKTLLPDSVAQQQQDQEQEFQYEDDEQFYEQVKEPQRTQSGELDPTSGKYMEPEVAEYIKSHIHPNFFDQFDPHGRKLKFQLVQWIEELRRPWNIHKFLARYLMIVGFFSKIGVRPPRNQVESGVVRGELQDSQAAEYFADLASPKIRSHINRWFQTEESHMTEEKRKIIEFMRRADVPYSVASETLECAGWNERSAFKILALTSEEREILQTFMADARVSCSVAYDLLEMANWNEVAAMGLLHEE
jgi:predicted transcriptional regulator